jgi:hypothetical protein
MTDELVTFLRARLDEDVATAQAAHPGGWCAHTVESTRVDGRTFPEVTWVSDSVEADGWNEPEGAYRVVEYFAEVPTGAVTRADAEHIARWDPARVLAEVQAKRRIIDLHKPRGVEGGPPYRWTCTLCDHAPVPWDSYMEWPCLTMRLLAAPYASHPDYRAEWALDRGAGLLIGVLHLYSTVLREPAWPLAFPGAPSCSLCRGLFVQVRGTRPLRHAPSGSQRFPSCQALAGLLVRVQPEEQNPQVRQGVKIHRQDHAPRILHGSAAADIPLS